MGVVEERAHRIFDDDACGMLVFVSDWHVKERGFEVELASNAHPLQQARSQLSPILFDESAIEIEQSCATDDFRFPKFWHVQQRSSEMPRRRLWRANDRLRTWR